MDDEDVLGNVLANEVAFRARLDGLQAAHNCVKEIRGTGYFYAMELMADQAGGRDLSELQKTTLEGGLLGKFVRDARTLVRPDDRGASLC